MKNKMINFLKNIGGCIASLLMLAPIYIIFNYETIKQYPFYLIASILYDFYMYSVINFNDTIKKHKETYDKVKNGKMFESDTEEKKMIWYKSICDNIMEDYLKK